MSHSIRLPRCTLHESTASPPRTPLPLYTQTSHLATHGNHHVADRFLVACPRVLHLAHNVHAVDDFAEDDVLVVEKGGWDGRDEELGTVSRGAGILRSRRRKAGPLALGNAYDYGANGG